MDGRDVVIVGGGPVGLLNALGLARAGLRVTVVEREPEIPASPRAAVYLFAVLDGLERLGILEDVERTGIRVGDGLNIHDFRGGDVIRWSMNVLEGQVAHPYNVHLGQDRLAGVVVEHLERIPDASVLWHTTLTGLRQDGDGVTVAIAGPGGADELRASWVIGADGARSAVRRHLGLDFEGMTWPERFVATNIRYPFEEHGFGGANMVLDPVHGAIVAKLDETGLWRCTYCEDAALPEETIPERMPEFFRAFLPDDREPEVVAWSPYRMHQRTATSMRVDRVLLAGDAAHATNPTGGLGLTSGLFDTYVLVDALAAVIRGEADDEVLDRYGELRRQKFLEVASPAASGFKQLVYHSHDREHLEAQLAGMRSLVGDDDARLANYLDLQNLATPSLL
jgi:3-(3-hydroxy-phenyl)propionate hydroxylase